MWQNLLNEARQAWRAGDGARADALLADVVPLVMRDARGLDQVAQFAGFLERRDLTVPLLEQAARLAPDDVGIRYHLGVAWEDRGDFDAARAEYQRVLEISPRHAAARLKLCGTHLVPIADSFAHRSRCRAAFEQSLTALEEHYRTHPDELPDLGQAVGESQPFLLAYHGENDRDWLSRWGRLVCRAAAAAFPHTRLPEPEPTTGDRQPFRLGIVSAHVHRHSVWKAITKGVVEQLDPRRFAITMFHVGGHHDDQTAAASQRVSRFFRGDQNASSWIDTIRNERCHALLYPELGMHTLTAQLAALRLAPVQCVAWGHPVTTGYPTLDFYLSADRFEPADAGAHYTERLVRLPHLGCHYVPLVDTAVTSPPNAPPPNDPAAVRAIRAAWPWPGEAIVYALPHRLFKFQPEDDAHLVALAQRVPEGRFVFFEHDRGGLATDRFRRRLTRAFAEGGLSFDERCLVLPRLAPRQFLMTIAACDVCLDALGFSGFNTAVEVLQTGTPVVTWESPLMRGRFAAGVLRQIGCAETVAATKEEFVAMAARWGTDRAARANLSHRLREAMPGLYGDPTFAAALGTFLEQSRELLPTASGASDGPGNMERSTSRDVREFDDVGRPTKREVRELGDTERSTLRGLREPGVGERATSPGPSLAPLAVETVAGARPAWHWLDGDNVVSPYRDDYVFHELLALIDRAPERVLDIGCHAGGNGAYVKRRYPQACVTGIEPRRNAAERARLVLDAVAEVTFEEFDFERAGILPASLDTVIFADVLEHMVHPWRTLQTLRPWLRPDAQLLVSLPNTRNLAVLGELAEGRFRYEPVGLLDVTHLRFFTATDAEAMFRETGYVIAQQARLLDPRFTDLFRQQANQPTPQTLRYGRLSLHDLSPADLGDLCARQLLYRLHPAP